MTPEGIGKRYTAKAACFASRVPHYKLNGWARGGFLRKLSVTARAGGWRRYSLEDVVAIALAGRLTNVGFEIRTAMDWATFIIGERRHSGPLGEMTIRWYADEQVISFSAAPKMPLPPSIPDISVTVNTDGIFDEVRARLIGSDDLDEGAFDPGAA